MVSVDFFVVAQVNKRGNYNGDVIFIFSQGLDTNELLIIFNAVTKKLKVLCTPRNRYQRHLDRLYNSDRRNRLHVLPGFVPHRHK